MYVEWEGRGFLCSPEVYDDLYCLGSIEVQVAV